uniref:Uncharacterized protein n=1 Tax=Romanomermis culicivorax TaxID=13658 RepID=A0A915KMP5_ROMCU
MDTLYNNEFSPTTPGEGDIPGTAPMQHLLPMAHPFGFLDYPPNIYYHHLRPRFDPPCLSHREEDCQIKTIVDNMHPLIMDGAPTNKRLLCFFIHLENKFGYDASNQVKMSAFRPLTRHMPRDMIQDMMWSNDP